MTEVLPEALRAGLVLDGEPGPAREVSAAEAEAMIAFALAAAGATATVVSAQAIGAGAGSSETVASAQAAAGGVVSRDTVVSTPVIGAGAGLGDTIVSAPAAPGGALRAATVRRLPVRTVIIAAAIGVSLAAAAGTLTWRAWSKAKSDPRPAEIYEPRDVVQPTPSDAPAASPASEDPLDDLPSMAEAQGDEARGDQAEPAEEPRRARAPLRRRPRRGDHRPGVEESARPGSGSASGEEGQEPPSRAAPEDLLASANALRAQRKWAEAERAYRRVTTEYPSSSSAYVAYAAAGTLRLERLSDARGALVLLQNARRAQPDGPLDPELRLAIAEAFLAMGRRDVAKRELVDLADTHPTSPQATAARRRLGEL